MTDEIDRAAKREAELLSDALRDQARRAGLVGKTVADSAHYCGEHADSSWPGCGEPIAQARREAHHRALAGRLDGMEAVNREEAAQWQRIERDLLRMQAEMPLHYVRREDYIRGQSVIEAKLDALGSKLEAAQLRAAAGGGNHAN